MGYQESFIQFKSVDLLKSELKKYAARDKEDDLAEIVSVNKVKEAVMPFKKGDLVAVVCGERSEQRDNSRLKEGLGIENVKNIVFIDNPTYYELSKDDFHGFLNKHFEQITEEEYQELIQ